MNVSTTITNCAVYFVEKSYADPGLLKDFTTDILIGGLVAMQHIHAMWDAATSGKMTLNIRDQISSYITNLPKTRDDVPDRAPSQPSLYAVYEVLYKRINWMYEDDKATAGGEFKIPPSAWILFASPANLCNGFDVMSEPFTVQNLWIADHSGDADFEVQKKCLDELAVSVRD